MVSIEQVVFPDPGARVLAILLIVLLVAGLATALLPLVRVRALAGAVVAVLAAVLLVVTQLVAQSSLVSPMRDLLLVRMVNVPQDLSAVATEEYLSDATGGRVGFWLALVVLVALGAINVTVGVRARRPLAHRYEFPCPVLGSGRGRGGGGRAGAGVASGAAVEGGAR
jgi:hypothetical protein